MVTGHDAAHDQLAALMGRATRHAMRHFERELEPLGVTPVEGTVLILLRYRRSASLGELARAWEVSSPMMSRTVERLAALGLVERREDAQDRRKITVTVTPPGEEVAQRTAEVGRAVTARMTSELNEGEVGRLKNYLGRIISALESYDEDSEEDATAPKGSAKR